MKTRRYYHLITASDQKIMKIKIIFNILAILVVFFSFNAGEAYADGPFFHKEVWAQMSACYECSLEQQCKDPNPPHDFVRTPGIDAFYDGIDWCGRKLVIWDGADQCPANWTKTIMAGSEQSFDVAGNCCEAPGGSFGSTSGNVTTLFWFFCDPIINGGWSDWSAQNTACGVSGTQTRTCTNPAPANGGADCSGSSSQSYTNPSCPVVVNGGWSEWGECSASCDGGTQTRSCNSPAPANGGASCSGSSSRSCNNQACPPDYSYQTPYPYQTPPVYSYQSPPSYSYQTPAGIISGLLTPSALFCIIPIGQSSCNINFSWNTL